MSTHPVPHATAMAVCLLLAPSVLLVAPVIFSTESAALTVPASPTMWLKYSQNPVLDIGPPGSFDSNRIVSSAIVRSDGKYYLYYNGDAGLGQKIGLATSSDGMSFAKYAANPVLDAGFSPSVVKDGPAFKMWYIGDGGLCHATSADGKVWTQHPDNPVLTNGSAGSWDARFSCVNVMKDGDVYKMWYSAGNGDDIRIGHATSTDGLRWTRYAGNPVLVQEESWEAVTVHSPCVLRVSGEYQMWYSAYGGVNTRICYANSTDGIRWQKYPQNPLMRASAPWETPNNLCPVVLYDGRDYRIWYTGTDADGRTGIGTAESTTAGPMAPVPLSPSDNAWTNLSRPVFSWEFGPPGDPDAQSAYQLQLDDSLDLASLRLDTGKVSLAGRSHAMADALEDGTYYWRVRAWDDFGEDSAWSGILTMRIDTARPAITRLTLNEGAAFTADRTVRLFLNASDPEPGSGVADMRHTENGVDWTNWEPFQSQLGIELPDSDRVWTVSVEVRDRVNNTSPAANASLLLDTTAPSQTGLQINNGDDFTNTVSVRLAISADDPSPATGPGGMAFSSDGATWTLWEPFCTTRAYNLTAGDGLKTIQIKIRDRAGNAGAPANASIILDTVPPYTSIVPIPVLSEELNFSVGWTAQDALSGIRGFDVEYRENDGAWTVWLNGTNLTSAAFSGRDGNAYSFRARSVDRAGNTGDYPATVSNKIRVVLPQPSVSILEPALSRTLKGKLLAAGAAGHPKPQRTVVLVEVSLDGGPWTPATGTLSWTFPLDTTRLKNGWHNISARSYDGVKYSAIATTDFKVQNEPAPTPSTSMPPMFLAVMAVAMAVVAAIVLLLLRAQRKARSAPSREDRREMPPPGAT